MQVRHMENTEIVWSLTRGACAELTSKPTPLCYGACCTEKKDTKSVGREGHANAGFIWGTCNCICLKIREFLEEQ